MNTQRWEEQLFQRLIEDLLFVANEISGWGKKKKRKINYCELNKYKAQVASANLQVLKGQKCCQIFIRKTRPRLHKVNQQVV